jgi:hypothetical protein
MIIIVCGMKMETRIEEFDITPHLKTNFRCFLSNKGLWRLEETATYGKWVFNIKPKHEKVLAPTYGDQKNFLHGLIEAERRNDNFVFKDGTKRPKQAPSKIYDMKQMLQVFEKKPIDVMDQTKLGGVNNGRF